MFPLVHRTPPRQALTDLVLSAAQQVRVRMTSPERTRSRRDDGLTNRTRHLQQINRHGFEGFLPASKPYCWLSRSSQSQMTMQANGVWDPVRRDRGLFRARAIVGEPHHCCCRRKDLSPVDWLSNMLSLGIETDETSVYRAAVALLRRPMRHIRLDLIRQGSLRLAASAVTTPHKLAAWWWCPRWTKDRQWCDSVLTTAKSASMPAVVEGGRRGGSKNQITETLGLLRLNCEMNIK